MFYIGLAIAAWLGGFIQTMVGFGAAVIVLLYLSNFMPMATAPSITAVVCLALNITMVLQFRHSVRVRKIALPLLIYSVISLLTVALVSSFQMTALTVFFGLFLIAIAVYYLFLAEKIKINDTGTPMMLVCSSLSGLFSGLFSCGGPTLSIYYLALLGSGEMYIANLQISFLLANTVLCVGRIAGGLLTADMIPSLLTGTAGAVFGQIIAKRLRGKLSTALLSRLVYIAVGVSGLLVIIQQSI